MPFDTNTRVVMFEHEDKNNPDDAIHVLVECFFTEKGELVVSGNDIGTRVERLTGDLDYEYSLTVDVAEVEKLAVRLEIEPGDQRELLSALALRFTGNEGFSSLATYMDEHGVKYQRFAY